MFELENWRLRFVALIGIALSLIVAILYIAPVRTALGGSTLLWFYDLSIIILAWLGAALSLMLARRFERGEVLRTIWLMLGVALLLWGLGEAIWAYYELVLQTDPYPSPADVVWVIGYIPLFAALALRFQSLQATPDRGQVIAIVVIAVAVAGILGVFVFAPILGDPEVTLVEKVVGVLYPVGDLIVGIGALLIMLVLIGGTLSRPWLFIALGFIVVSAADLLYTYADWQGLYLSGSDKNLLSALSDVPYYISYIIIDFGLILQARLQKII
jgi:hypothetical protein